MHDYNLIRFPPIIYATNVDAQIKNDVSNQNIFSEKLSDNLRKNPKHEHPSLRPQFLKEKNNLPAQ